MFPQFLVQNELLVDNENSFISTQLNALLNANFYHVWKLVDESEHYKNSLQLWEENKVNDISELEFHQYCYINGHLIGKINNTDYIIITQPLTRYALDNQGRFVATDNYNKPSVFRGRYGAGLNTPISNLLLSDWTYDIETKTYAYDFTAQRNEILLNISLDNIHPQISFDNDQVFGCLMLDNDCFANINISVSCQWNSQISAYEYYFTFPLDQIAESLAQQIEVRIY